MMFAIVGPIRSPKSQLTAAARPVSDRQLALELGASVLKMPRTRRPEVVAVSSMG